MCGDQGPTLGTIEIVQLIFTKKFNLFTTRVLSRHSGSCFFKIVKG